jgi:plastocyanin/predicted lipoprotein with Yx(FWY)xxD motif
LNFKTVSIIFVVLTVIFGGATAYLAAFPAASTTTIFSTRTSTSTVSATLPTGSVEIAYKPALGFYLTNGTGFALYFRSTDKPYSGNTTCVTATCEKNWPAFHESTLSIPTGLNASAFGVITPYNSTKIVTYDGYPLFYWAHDSKSGDTTGQGVGDFYVATVPAPSTSVTTSTSTTSTPVSPQAARVMIPSGASSNQSSLGTLGFYPNNITVVVGINSTVVWTNNDAVTHSVVSFSVPSGAQAFSDVSLAPGGTFSVTLTVPGTYKYHCTIHPWMIGTIVVVSHSTTTSTTTSSHSYGY